MKKIIITQFFILVFIIKGFSQLCPTCPSDNPLATYYGLTGDYAFWTDEINWAASINMATYSNGSTNFEKFKNARDYLYSIGGGVLYYPAGTYNFDIPDGIAGEGLMLKKGVVIRGQAPTNDASAVTTTNITAMSATDHGLKNLPTKFVFTTVTLNGGPLNKAWNQVGCKKGTYESNLGDVSHVGIAWVEINHGYVYFGMDNKRWSSSYSTGVGYIGGAAKAVGVWANRHADGTLPMDLFTSQSTAFAADTGIIGSKRFVFGCLLMNAGMCNYMVNKSAASNFIADPYPFAWTGKIMVYGSHIFIANNVIAKPTASFKPFSWTCKSGGDTTGTIKTRFDYGYGIGIEVNKSAAAGFMNRCAINHPTLQSIYYAEDVVIQDNVIYNHGNKSIEASGKWAVIKNNMIPRQYLAHNDDPYGIGTVSYGVNWSNGKCYNDITNDDMMSRALDMGGWNMWIDNVKYKGTGTNYANDGEGILCQRHNGIEVYSWAETNIERCKGCVGKTGYLAPYDVHVLGYLCAFTKQPGEIGFSKTMANWHEDVSVIEDLNLDLNDVAITPSGVTGTNVKDFQSGCPSTVTLSDTVVNWSIEYSSIDYSTTISYQDNSVNEIGYRIEKQHSSKNPIKDPWVIVAYRPRQETTTLATLNTIPATFGYTNTAGICFPSSVTIDDMNSPKWIDFKGNPGGTYRYRIVTIDCNNNSVAATGLPKLVGVYSTIKMAPKVIISPNPATTKTTISFELELNETANVDLISIDGKVKENLATNIIDPIELNVNNYISGIYVVKISTNKGRITNEKLIIK